MAVENINHINIYTHQPLLDRVRDFYVDIIGLSEGPRPPLPVPDYWLYAAGQPIMHLMVREEEQLGMSVTHLDHIAFTCHGLEETKSRFSSLDIEYKERNIPEFGIVQLFVVDPTGLGVEMNFQVVD